MTATSPSTSAGVPALVASMSMDEKLTFLAGSHDPEALGQSVYLPGVPRLGIPPLRMTDGPAGVRMKRKTTTALPAPIALSCTFDNDLAFRYGAYLAHESRAKRQDVLIGPMINLLRQPYGGRNFELYGEDPLLVAGIGTAVITGIQEGGVLAMAKHFVANNQEQDRMHVDTRVDDRTLREMELPAFEAAVAARVGALMGATNQVNGAYSCENATLLDGILRQEWGFDGWVMSDWDAVHDTAAITAGLDQEMPDGKHLGEPLAQAVLDGRIAESVVDRSVTRILNGMARLGMLDGFERHVPERDDARGRELALEVATRGAVLLHNRGVLPLSDTASRPGGLAVIGFPAAAPKIAGVGSALVVPEHADSPLEVLRARLGADAVVYEVGEDPVGIPVPESVLTPAFRSGEVPPGPSDEPNYFYEGSLTITKPGRYRFSATALGGYGALDLEGQERLFMGSSFGDTAGLTVDLEPGVYKLVLSALPVPSNPVQVTLNWVTPEHERTCLENAVAAARAAETAVVFAYDELAELIDRPSLTLPGTQDRLITEVARANPNTVVVLNTGSSVPMPWLDLVAGVLDVWYPGEEGAAATAALLFGDANPSGRLTQSFPVDESSTAVSGDLLRYPGVDGRVEYSEGVHIGYRWHDHTGVAPLFPFGYGLSYTKFAYDNLEIATENGSAVVRFTVRNVGDRAGYEVAQVYLGAPQDLDVAQAPKSLAAYRSVHLEPGAAERVEITLEPRRFQYWLGAWTFGAGERAVLVGRSATEIVLESPVVIEADGAVRV